MTKVLRRRRYWRPLADRLGDIQRRLEAKSVEAPGPLLTPCLLWTGRKTNNGYGITEAWGRGYVAHRLYWILLNGPVPKGQELDHLCHVRHCMRREHLEPVTHAENVRRSHQHRITATP